MGHQRYLEYSTGEKKIQTKNARTSNNKMQLDSRIQLLASWQEELRFLKQPKISMIIYPVS